MFAGLIAAAALASAQPKTAAPAKEQTPAELKAENAQLKQQVSLLQGLATAYRVQRDQNAEQAAEAAARLQAQAH